MCRAGSSGDGGGFSGAKEEGAAVRVDGLVPRHEGDTDLLVRLRKDATHNISDSLHKEMAPRQDADALAASRSASDAYAPRSVTNKSMPFPPYGEAGGPKLASPSPPVVLRL